LWNSPRTGTASMNLDNIRLDTSSVPEPPSVFSLLAAGLGMALVAVRRLKMRT
jgi:hypothetical protein